MTSPRDDDALSWAGDDDPTLAPSAGAADRHGPSVEEPAAAVSGPDAAGSRGASEPAASDGDVVTQPGMSNAALISLGVLGGVYLLYTFGWIFGGLRLQSIVGLIVVPSVSVPALVLAILAPALWFLTSYVLTRHARAWVRFSWLIAGALLLVPWPLLTFGAA